MYWIPCNWLWGPLRYEFESSELSDCNKSKGKSSTGFTAPFDSSSDDVSEPKKLFPRNCCRGQSVPSRAQSGLHYERHSARWAWHWSWVCQSLHCTLRIPSYPTLQGASSPIPWTKGLFHQRAHLQDTSCRSGTRLDSQCSWSHPDHCHWGIGCPTENIESINC